MAISDENNLKEDDLIEILEEEDISVEKTGHLSEDNLDFSMLEVKAKKQYVEMEKERIIEKSEIQKDEEYFQKELEKAYEDVKASLNPLLKIIFRTTNKVLIAKDISPLDNEEQQEIADLVNNLSKNALKQYGEKLEQIQEGTSMVATISRILHVVGFIVIPRIVEYFAGKTKKS